MLTLESSHALRPAVFATILNQISEGICVIQEDGEIVYQNLAAIVLLGRNYCGKRIGDIRDLKIFGPDRVTEIPLKDFFLGCPQQLYRETDAGCSIRSGKGRHLAFVHSLASRYHDQQEERSYHVLTMRNVTPEKKEVDHLIQVNEDLEYLNRSKTEFLANVSHEIRTPLGAILGFSEMMANPKLGSGERKMYHSIIDRNGKTLLQLVDDLLDLSKIEAGKFEIRNVAFALMDELQALFCMMESKAWTKGVRFLVHTEGVLPTHIYSDPVRIRQILINLIGNAIKFTDRGIVTLTIRHLEARGGEQEQLEFLVSDSGCGIPESVTSRLFLPFEQGDPSITRVRGGAGLGLALAKRLAVALDGDVQLVGSIVNKGSIFRCVIHPHLNKLRTTPQHWSLTKESATRPDVPLRLGARGLSVLLVEDGVDNQLLYRSIMEQAGIRVDVAGNGQEALELLQKQTYDVTLMDLQMPILDGYSAIRSLRQNNYSKPVIALTAHAMKGERERCLEAGFNEYLTKPVTRQALVATIAELGRNRPKGEIVPMCPNPPDDKEPFNDPDLRPIVISIFKKLPSRLAELEGAISKQDWDTVAMLSHRLKGTLGGCGFKDLSAIAGSIEMEAKSGRSVSTTLDLFKNLEEAIAGTEVVLNL